MALSGDTKLGGRLFNVVNYDVITVLNEHYIMKLMRETGLDVVLPLSEGESNDAYMLRIHAALVDTLKLPQLLGGYLLPAGKTEETWTVELAGETARFIEGLAKQEDRAEVHRLGLLVTFDFFRAGLALLETSRRYFESLKSSPAKTHQKSQVAAH